MTSLLLWLYTWTQCSAVGNDCGAVQSRRIVEQDPPVTQIETGTRAVVVRVVVPRRRYFVRLRYCFTTCTYPEVETTARGYDRATQDQQWREP